MEDEGERQPTLNLPEKGGYVSLMVPHLYYVLAGMSSLTKMDMCSMCAAPMVQ